MKTLTTIELDARTEMRIALAYVGADSDRWGDLVHIRHSKGKPQIAIFEMKGGNQKMRVEYDSDGEVQTIEILAGFEAASQGFAPSLKKALMLEVTSIQADEIIEWAETNVPNTLEGKSIIQTAASLLRMFPRSQG